MQTEIVLHNDRRMEIIGVSWGKLTFCAWNKQERLLAFKVGGHHYFGGTGSPQNYAPAQFVVFKYHHLEVDADNRIHFYSNNAANGIMHWGARP